MITLVNKNGLSRVQTFAQGSPKLTGCLLCVFKTKGSGDIVGPGETLKVGLTAVLEERWRFTKSIGFFLLYARL